MAAALPQNEHERLRALRAIDILDSPAEPAYDDVVRIASQLCAVPIAIVSVVDEHRQWFKAKVGIDLCETARDDAFSAHAILDDDIFVVNDAREDPRFATNPHVVGDPHVRFYAGAPIRIADGIRIGSLCVIDRIPRTFTREMREAVLALRRQVEAHIALRLHIRQLEASRSEIERFQREKDRFLQFVIHDMKGSVASISVNAQILQESVCDREAVREIGSDVLEAAQQLDRLVADLMDLGRAEAGQGLAVHCKKLGVYDALTTTVKTFIRRAMEAGVTLVVSPKTPVGLSVDADPHLVERVLRNLTDNALRHAPRGSTVTLQANRVGGEVLIGVLDEGPGIPPEMRADLFELYRQGPDPSRRGRGIGLAFCRTAIEAHDGRIWVEERHSGGSSFCFALPTSS